MSGIGSHIAKFGLPVVHVGGEPVPPPRPSLLRRIPVPSPIRAIAAGGERATMLVIAALMLVYLTGGLVLAINVNRGFLLNDAMALLAFGTILGGLALASWRGSMR